MNAEQKERGTRLFEFAERHSLVILAVAVVLFFVLVLFGPAFLLGVREAFSNRAIEETKQAAATEKTAAQQEKLSAEQNQIERKAEDLNRSQNLQPKRQQAAANLEEATRRRKAAEDRYENDRQNRRSPDVDDVTLRRRNCADLAELYPDSRFAGCP